jgi:hypothetical protein
MSTVADVAKVLARRKEKYEKFLKTSSGRRERQTAERMLERIQRKEDELFEYQESKSKPKGNDSVPKYANGTLLPIKSRMPEDLIDDLAAPVLKRASFLKDSSLSNNTPKNSILDMLNTPDVKQFASNMLPLAADWALTRDAVGRMKAPTAPLNIPNVRLNKTMDISSQLNESARARQMEEQFAQRSFSAPQTVAAYRQKAKIDDLNRKGQLYGQQLNYRTDMGNQEARMNSMIAGQNTMTQNQYLQTLGDFNNNRTAAMMNNNTNLFTKFQQYMRDRKLDELDQKKWALLMKKYNPAVNADLKDE